ncbi:hypothetical protein CC80DRAFT_550688 [Byssothecium circinans]|uniref:F-box domain-containing protein n=1 Tax=Byssothecium circinans TaxID=147558 RepID=A0A6A5TQI7_9PLEO|nr:hypothetical protein CC80DRAFT_550688 [Byssothecium circinans]
MGLSDLNDDVLLEIIKHLTSPLSYDWQDCRRPPTFLKNLSLVNRRFRGLLKPILLRSVVLTKTKDGDDPSADWKKARRAIDGLFVDVTVHERIISLRLDLYGRFRDHDYTSPNELIAFFRHLTGLRRLQIEVPNPYIMSFEFGVNTPPRLQFECVTTILVEYRLVSLLHHCRQLRNVAIYNTGGGTIQLSQLGLRDVARSAPNITHFEATSSWTDADIEHLGLVFPWLEHLCLHDTTATLLMFLE